MNKVVNINLNGIIISIDELAYDKLKKYMDALHHHFSGKSGAAEIISDIETRIAELLQLKLTDSYTVIQMNDVDDVMGVMGNPWEMDAEEGEEKAQTKEEQKEQTNFRDKRLKRDPRNKVLGGVCGGIGNYLNIDPIFARAAFLIAMFVFGTGFLFYIILWAIIPEATPNELPPFTGSGSRKLYRNGDNQMIGGVCSGIAAYVGVDEVWLRIAFVASFLFFGTGFLAYIILWIIIPEAKTASEKLHMRGSPIDVNHIENEVRNSASQVKQTVKSNQALSTFLKIVAIGIAAIVFIVFILPLGFSLLYLLFGVENSGDFTVLLKSLAINDALFATAKWGIIALVASVIVGFVSFVMRLFVRFKFRYLALLSGTLSVIGVTLLVYTGINYADEVKQEAVVVEEMNPMSVQDTLTIRLNDILVDEDVKRFDVEIDHEDVSWAVEQGVLFFNKPKLVIKPATNGKLTVKIKREARGSSITNAEELAAATEVGLEVDSSQVVFNNWLKIGDKPYKQQQASIGLWIPVGTILKVNSDVLEYLDGFDEDEYSNDDMDEMPYQYFRVTAKGWECITCANNDWSLDFSIDEKENGEASFDVEEITTDSVSKDGKVRVVKETKKIGPIRITHSKTVEHKR